MKILSVIGTRPDAIKLLPVVHALHDLGVQSLVCATQQHTAMLDQVMTLFGARADFNLHVMTEGQDLFHITQQVLEKIKVVLDRVQPDMLLVQGDTTTAFAAALAAFYKKIPVGHVEAGLRTGSLSAPYPEEMNRRFIGMIATYHFAATSLNVGNLLAERVDRAGIVLTGNTVVDALHMIIDKIKAGSIIIDPMLVSLVKELKAANKKVVLLTAHRRESFGEGLENIFNAVRTMSALIPDVAFIYPHHPNPHVVQAITASGIDRVAGVHMLPPLDYAHLVYCLLESNWIATDSGGIQEEAISLGKPVVVLRELTERIEGVWDGIAQLAGTNSEKIIQCMLHAHTQKQSDSSKNIYGDGQAGKKIASFIMSVQTEKHPVIGSTNKPVHSLFDQNVNP